MNPTKCLQTVTRNDDDALGTVVEVQEINGETCVTVELTDSTICGGAASAFTVVERPKSMYKARIDAGVDIFRALQHVR